MRKLLRYWLTAIFLLTFFWTCNHLRSGYDRAHSAVDLKNPPPVGGPSDSQVTGGEQPHQPSVPQAATTAVQVAHSVTSVATPASDVAGTPTSESPPAQPTTVVPDKVVVLGKLEEEDTSWVTEEVPGWQHAIYIVNNSTAEFHTPANKGKEAMPYLTYLIDHYDSLPSTIAFIHGHRDGWPQAWHTDADGYSNAKSLNTLNVNFVQRNGYANLRCIHIPGCPDEVKLHRESHDENREGENNMETVWRQFFNTTPPDIIGVACCAQFAVSRDQVRKRPLEDYKRYRQWILETKLDDELSGRIMEYLWHIIFGREPVYCPELERCYCDVYGKC